MKQSKILIVNDDITQLDMIGSILKNEGFKTYTAQEVDEALKIMTKEPPDLIITDLHMPGVDGWRFCRLLRSNEYKIFNKTPILIVSATFSGPHTLEITSDLGANAFLPMPFSAIQLKSYVNSILEGKTLVQIKKVLIIEDSRSISAVLKDAFNTYGYTIYTAMTGEEGKKLFREYLPEIVVIDYHLPDILGDELLEGFKKLTRQAVFIMITNDPTPALAVKFMQKGANAYVRKPFDPEYLIHICEMAFRERSLLSIEEILEDRTQELKESEQRYHSLFSSMVSGFALGEIIYDSDKKTYDYRFLDVNPAFEKITGFSRNRVMGKTGQEILESEPEWVESFVKVALTGEATHFETFSRVLNKYFDITVYSPKKGQFAFTFNDITERKKLQDQLVHTQKMEAIGQLAGGIAHDFNNILSGILGYANLIRLDVEINHPVYSAAKTIEKAALRASELTQKLLGFARRGKHQNIPVDIHEIITEAIMLLRRTIDKNILITQKLKSQSALVQGDPVQMQQVMLNLAINARDAMSEGGELIFETDNIHMEEKDNIPGRDLLPGDYVVISVTDTGCGIPENHINHIFEPFFTTKEKDKGTGMGLAMVYGIIKNHNGAIEVHSKLGKGTTFKIYLPITTDNIISSHHDERAISHGSGKIMIIDDEEIVRDMVSDMLKRLNYHVVTAENGRVALNYYRNSWHEIDAVILDMIMPEMGGGKCFQEMKKINPNIKAILSTGYGLNNKVQEVIDNGISGFIQKPYHMKELAEKINKLLQ